ncbi:MAG: 4Fe-4S dicluster domain-containing protein [Bacteroidales bacterium]|nr:4Fe-4S dicluster domain-containing protein [Bacteroidales bacterium]
MRVTIATFMIALITLYFIDFLDLMPEELKYLPRIQWVPALLMVTPVVSVLLLLSLLFGRVFCSAICPLGIFQDILIRVSSLFYKRRKHKYTYQKPKSWIRYTVLFLTLASFMSGTSALVVWLDPYSNFGRIISNIVRPAVIYVNNFIAAAFIRSGNYNTPLYSVEITGLTWFSSICALAVVAVLIAFTFKHGRMYCNVVCPVGTFLGMLSKVSLFRVKLDDIKCTSCGLCGMSCKSECIDSENKKIDETRCVSCFNCLKVCKKGGIGYKFILPSSVKTLKPAFFSKKEIEKKTKKDAVDQTRRDLIITTGVVGGAMIAEKLSAKAIENDPAAHRKPIMPPGAQDRESFNKSCTACHLCITKCPSKVLTPAFTEYGLEGVFEPTVKYKNGFCNYNCDICASVCPTGALRPLPIEEKRLTKIGVAHLRLDLCIVTNDHHDCGACSEHCPTQAVKMVPFENGLTRPQLDPDLCIGCGGCEFICPVRPFQAIYIEGVERQTDAKKPEAKKIEKAEVDDFGF